MSFFSSCVSYSDIKGKIRTEDGYVYVSLKDEKDDLTISVSFNPMQAIELAKSMMNVAKQVCLTSLPTHDYLGGIEIEMAVDNKEDIVALPVSIPESGGVQDGAAA